MRRQTSSGCDPWHILVSALVCTFSVACATTEKTGSTGPQTPAWTHYTLKFGDPLPGALKMPTQVPIWVNWFNGETQVGRALAYRGWDFNGDGTFEMVECLSGTLKVESRVYAFGFDGRPSGTAPGPLPLPPFRKLSDGRGP